MSSVKNMIDEGRTAIGIELGSTRIKACMIDEAHNVIASGSFSWENRFENGVWTYGLSEIEEGIRSCYKSLTEDVAAKYGTVIKKTGSIGISGMMHGYMAFDAGWNLLAPFRTWRNTITGDEAQELSEAFGFNIPQRWSIAHLYHAVKGGEEHVKRLVHLTTLAGYIHYRLSGENVLGIGEASGMFPIDSAAGTYDAGMMAKYDDLTGCFPKKLAELLPAVKKAGEGAGVLTAAGAAFLDESGVLQAGALMAPPEGDAGTGMVATNALRACTGNVSAGTSDFAMVVLDKPIATHMEIDMVTTPTGLPVAMVHCNNCTSDINAWAGLFAQFAGAFGMNISTGDLFTKLFTMAQEGAKDGGGLIPVNYISGESITGFDEGRPLFIRQGAGIGLADFMRANLMSAIATLGIGMRILADEGVKITSLTGHGGYFKTGTVGASLLSAACVSPVTLMETAGEGGPYGMALLAGYAAWKKGGESLEDYLDAKVFADAKKITVNASAEDVDGFKAFLAKYEKALKVERAAVEVL